MSIDLFLTPGETIPADLVLRVRAGNGNTGFSYARDATDLHPLAVDSTGRVVEYARDKSQTQPSLADLAAYSVGWARAASEDAASPVDTATLLLTRFREAVDTLPAITDAATRVAPSRPIRITATASSVQLQIEVGS